MRISFVEPHLELFGGIRRVLELSNRLVERGEDVTIYHPRGTPCTWMECRARVAPLSSLHRDDHDVVIFNDPPHYKLVRRARAKLKVFYVLGLYERERLRRFTLKLLWPKKGRVVSIKRILQLPFLKIVNATWMKDFLEGELGVPCEVVLGGVNEEMFHPVEVEKDGSRIVILCSGDPREYKGTGTVEEAVEIVRRNHPGVLLESYYGKNIPQSEMARKYASADIFVDAQWDTGSGWNNPVAEAMACGVPVVCTDIKGVSDFAFDEETALLVPERDPVAMAAAIERLVVDAGLRERLARRAYGRIGRFGWNEAADRLRSILAKHLIEKQVVK